MKTTIKLFMAIALTLLLFTSTLFAQDDAPTRPAYVVATTFHWNMDNEDFDMEEWIALEKEYLDKVTKKNELVVGAGVYLHRFTPDNTELIFVRTYASWDDIDKSGDRDGELAKEAWPDDEARSAFFDKRFAYYAPQHADEIYATMSGAKLFSEAPGEDMILYLQKNHFAFPEDGTNDEFTELFTEYVENVFHKNEHIKAYFPSAHAWGSDRTEFVEAFFVNSMGDVGKMFDRNGELEKEHWPDEAKRKEFFEKADKYLTGRHGDYFYSVVEQLSK
jgi:hypothetical protein